MLCRSSGCWPHFMDNSPLPTWFVTALVVGSHGQHPHQHALPEQWFLASLHGQLLFCRSSFCWPRFMDISSPNIVCHSICCWFSWTTYLPTCSAGVVVVGLTSWTTN